MSLPTISQAGSTAESIDIQFTAGSPTGAPAGFSLQWMTAADYAANGNQWYLSASTDACPAEQHCGHSWGYWKSHAPYKYNASTSTWDANPNADWPTAVTSLTLGNRSYDLLELSKVMNQNAGGNWLIALAHQLITAKLNQANGVDVSAIATAMADADTAIGNLVVPPIGSGTMTQAQGKALTLALRGHAEGALMCGGDPTETP